MDKTILLKGLLCAVFTFALILLPYPAEAQIQSDQDNVTSQEQSTTPGQMDQKNQVGERQDETSVTEGEQDRELPETAGATALLGLLGGFSMFGAAALRYFKRN